MRAIRVLKKKLSATGSIWRGPFTGSTADNFVNGVEFVGNAYLRHTYEKVYYSISGTNWTESLTNGGTGTGSARNFATNGITKIGNTAYICVPTKYSDNTYKVFSTTNGSSWGGFSISSATVGEGFAMQSVAFGNNRWVVSFLTRNHLSSSDLVNWQSLTAGGPLLKFGNGVFVHVNRFGTSGGDEFFYSADGITFTNSGFTIPGKEVSALNFCNNAFFATVDNRSGFSGFAGIYRSTDGLNWANAWSTNTAFLSRGGVVFANGVYLAAFKDLSNNQILMRSFNGVDWVQISNIPNATTAWLGSRSTALFALDADSSVGNLSLWISP